MTQKGTGSLEVAMTYFKTPKVTITFVVGLTKFMTLKVHGVIRARRDLLYDLKGYGEHCRRFDHSLWPQKVTVSLEVAVTYFMTPKGHKWLVGRFDLVYDPERSQGH